MKRLLFLSFYLLLAIITLLPASEGETVSDPSKEKIPYPLKTCLVSGSQLGEMGPPVTLLDQNREMKFCCKDCIEEFEKNRDKYRSLLKEKSSPPL